jgi:orotate phosphoribosyltransferase
VVEASAGVDVLRKLERARAVLTGRHFVYKSGKHGSGYINMDMVFPDLSVTRRLCELLAEPFREEGIEVVAAPAVGGIVLAALTALSLDGPDPGVTAVWADKDGDGFAFERAGFADRLGGKAVLVVEDLLTTGGSVSKVCRLVEQAGGLVRGVSVVCNRGGVTAEQLGVPRLESLTHVDFEAVDELECELCGSAVPIVEDVGHGAEFKARHPDYAGGYVRLQG